VVNLEEEIICLKKLMYNLNDFNKSIASLRSHSLVEETQLNICNERCEPQPSLDIFNTNVRHQEDSLSTSSPTEELASSSIFLEDQEDIVEMDSMEEFKNKEECKDITGPCRHSFPPIQKELMSCPVCGCLSINELYISEQVSYNEDTQSQLPSDISEQVSPNSEIGFGLFD